MAKYRLISVGDDSNLLDMEIGKIYETSEDGKIIDDVGDYRISPEDFEKGYNTIFEEVFKDSCEPEPNCEEEKCCGVEHIEKTRPNVAHYNDCHIQPIDLINAQNLNFNMGNVVKYACRNTKKGQQLEDLEKIKIYAQFEIERLGAI